MKTKMTCLLLLLSVAQGIQAQLVSLNSMVQIGGCYNLSFHGKNLYAATSQGLSLYSVDNKDGDWTNLSFPSCAVRDFVVRGDTVIALTDTILYVSADGGLTVKSIPFNIIAPEWKNNSDSQMKLSSLSMHPTDAMRFYVAYGGVSYTEDGGNTWVEMNIPQYIEGLFYNPSDETNLIAFANKSAINIDRASVYVSTDGGKNWDNTGGYTADAVTVFESIAFHPTDKNKIIICGSGIYAMSEDQGKTWRTVGEEPSAPNKGITPAAYLNDLVYDSRNPNILYGADMMAVYENVKKVRILRSTDGGLSWSTFYTFEPESWCAVPSISMDENILAISASVAGIYLLDVDAVDTSVPAIEKDVLDTPYYDLQGRPVDNPIRGIYIKDGKKTYVGD